MKRSQLAYLLIVTMKLSRNFTTQQKKKLKNSTRTRRPQFLQNLRQTLITLRKLKRNLIQKLQHHQYSHKEISKYHCQQWCQICPMTKHWLMTVNLKLNLSKLSLKTTQRTMEHQVAQDNYVTLPLLIQIRKSSLKINHLKIKSKSKIK